MIYYLIVFECCIIFAFATITIRGMIQIFKENRRKKRAMEIRKRREIQRQGREYFADQIIEHCLTQIESE